MSRFLATPNKSFRKNREYYANLDDPCHPNVVVKAPRKDRRKKPIFSSMLDSSFDYTFPSTRHETRDESTESGDVNFSPCPGGVEEETRDQLEPWDSRAVAHSDRHDTRFNRDSNFDCDRSFPIRDGNFNEWTVPTVSTGRKNELYSPPRLPRHTSIYDGIFCSSHRPTVGNKNGYPIQVQHGQPKVIHRRMVPRVTFQYHEIIGPRSLNIHRLRLPSEYLHLLDKIVSGCEDHASKLACGWNTDLYSLTKQDIALREAPEVYDLARPIVSYVKKVACAVYGVQGLKCDRNQPHVLKYAGEHRGVELHHDKSDITVNLMMSRSSSYHGGGTFFPDASVNVRLEFGEFLLHPGSCVHGGSKISNGTRYLMVIFANEK